LLALQILAVVVVAVVELVALGMVVQAAQA
jgi:hypothetical protein